MPAISQSFRCFDEVARCGSIRKAAAGLHLTPAAVNQQVLNLEATVGARLFDRLPRGMLLTAAGEIMVASIRRSQRDFDSALSQVEDLRALRRGHVAVGVPHSTAEHLLPRVIARMMASHPGLTFSVRSGAGEQLLHWVAGGEVDVAYCLRRPVPPGVEEVRAIAQRMGVVTAPGHALVSPARKLRLRDCLDHPLVLMSSDMELRTVLERIDPRVTRRGRPVVETSSVPMVRQLVAQGAAVGFMLPENVDGETTAGTLRWTALEDSGAHLHSCLFQRSGSTMSVSMAVFVDELERAVHAVGERFRTQGAPPPDPWGTPK